MSDTSQAIVEDRAARLIDGLMELHPKGYDLSLGRIRNLLEKLGNPQDKLPPVIHVAGTNGKGSTIAFMRAIAEEAGMRVHSHTSPHLVRWHERYRMAGTPRSGPVDDDLLADAIERVATANDGAAITVFEILTAVAFLLFSENEADLCLMEVGLGGRFDATNVMENKTACVVTPVSLDHMSHLGTTPERIAHEKAGILREGTPAIIADQPFETAREALEQTALRHGVTPLLGGQDFHAHEERGRLVYQDVQHGGVLLDLPLPFLVGRHQITNAATAIATLRKVYPLLPTGAVERGLEATRWPARLQRVKAGPLTGRALPGTEIWLDGGHNAHAGEALAAHLAHLEEGADRPMYLIAGMLQTKEPLEFFRPFEGLVRHVFCVPIESDAGFSPETLAAIARDVGLSAEAVDSVETAFDRLFLDWTYERRPRVLIGGSLYLAGEVLRENG